MFDNTCNRSGHAPDPGPSTDRAQYRPQQRQAEVAAPFPMPVPLLMQLTKPLNTLEAIDSLAAHLNCARARGCF